MTRQVKWEDVTAEDEAIAWTEAMADLVIAGKLELHVGIELMTLAGDKVRDLVLARYATEENTANG